MDEAVAGQGAEARELRGNDDQPVMPAATVAAVPSVETAVVLDDDFGRGKLGEPLAHLRRGVAHGKTFLKGLTSVLAKTPSRT